MALGAERSSIVILIPDQEEMMFVTGESDRNLERIERAFDVKMVARGAELRVGGDASAVARVSDLIAAIRAAADRDEMLRAPALEHLIDDAQQATPPTAEQLRATVATTVRGRRLMPQSTMQAAYVEAMRKHDLAFAIGPAGTGKSLLAVAMAVNALRERKVTRIVLTRPAVEAGERLGFLPGQLAQKMDPYLRPLYDALYELMPAERIARAQERAEIEIAPLAFMRGRAQPYFSLVLTPTGFRHIGSLRVGDRVIGSNGLPTRVLGVYPQGRKQVYRVQTQDGASTLCCGEHLWSVATADDRRRGEPLRVVQTRDMIGKLRAAHRHRFELPLVSQPVEFESRALLMDPYALGLLLGDGCLTTSTTPTFTTADRELAFALEAALPHVDLFQKSAVDYVLRNAAPGRGGVIVANPVTVVVRQLGLAGTRSNSKFIPAAYLYNSSDVRLAVLQGLLDTDGGPVTQRARTCRIQYSTTSEQLKDDVVFLVRSLGGVAYWRKRPAAGRPPGRARGRNVARRSDAYVLDIRLPEGIMPFRLPRKGALYQASGGGRPMRFIDSIEPAGEEEAVCINVAAFDSLYVTDDFLVTHNTLNEAFIILDEAQNTTPLQMKMFLTRIGYGSKAVVTGDITQIDLPHGSGSGLVLARQILHGVPGIAFVEFSDKDVVRHELVTRIVRAYEAFERQQPQ